MKMIKINPILFMLIVSIIVVVLVIYILSFLCELSGISNEARKEYNKPIETQLQFCNDVIVGCQRYKNVIVMHSNYSQEQKYKLLKETDKTIYLYNGRVDSLTALLKKVKVKETK